MPPQFSVGDICQIRTWYSIHDQRFDDIEKRENNGTLEIDLVTPTPADDGIKAWGCFPYYYQFPLRIPRCPVESPYTRCQWLWALIVFVVEHSVQVICDAITLIRIHCYGTIKLFVYSDNHGYGNFRILRSPWGFARFRRLFSIMPFYKRKTISNQEKHKDTISKALGRTEDTLPCNCSAGFKGHWVVHICWN